MYSLPQSYNQNSKCKRCISSNAYDSQYCPILSEHFEITNPTCEEFERIKTGNLTFLSTEPKSAYEASSFFLLENRLKNKEFFQMRQV